MQIRRKIGNTRVFKHDGDHADAGKGSCCGAKAHCDGDNKLNIAFFGNLIKSCVIHCTILTSLFSLLAYFVYGITIKLDKDFFLSCYTTSKSLFGTLGLGFFFSMFLVGIFSKMNNSIVVGFLSGGESRIKRFLKCISAGLLLHTCNHGIILVAVQFYKKGLPLGLVVAFLLATPWTSAYAVFIFIAIGGFKLFAAIFISSIILAFTSAWIIDFLEDHHIIKPNPNKVHHDNLQDITYKEVCLELFRKNKDLITFRGFYNTWKGGFYESLPVLKWIVISLVISSFVITAVAIGDNSTSAVFNTGPSGILNTLLFATLIEMCTEGTAPMAALIAVKSNAFGNAFLILISGISTDYTEISSLRAATGYWRNAFSLPIVVVPQSIVIAVIINYIFS